MLFFSGCQNNSERLACGMASLRLTDAEVIRVAMRLLGQRTSKRKAKSSRENGKLDGAPRKHKHAPKRPYKPSATVSGAPLK